MTKLLTILTLIPKLIEVVKAVESAIPITGKGKEKLEAVIDIMQATGDDIAGIIPILSTVISRIVALFNATGVFAKEA